MPMGAAWIGPAIQGTVGIGEMAYGAHQKSKAKSLLADLERPTYEIPEEILQNVSVAERIALEGLPEQERRNFVENIQRSTQAGGELLQERGLGVAGVAALGQNEADAYKMLLGADVAAKREGQGAAAQARSSLASFREREFQINQFEPYMQSYLEGQALLGAGEQNIQKGAASLAESGANLGPSIPGMG